MQRRQFIGGAAMAIAAISSGPVRSAPPGVQRLNWAGIRIVASSNEILVDPVVTDIWNGDSPHPIVTPEAGEKRRYALITHTHGDHFDVPGLKSLLGDRGRVVCHASDAAYVGSRGLTVIGLEPGQTLERSDFTATPLPAADGLGSMQVTWIITTGGKRFIHCGDSLWHGKLRQWGQVFGPFDAAFLPINGAVQRSDPPSEVPLSMTPQQAVDAALLLRARKLLPIHYGFHAPGEYEEFPDAIERVAETAERRGMPVVWLQPGDWLDDMS